MALRSVENEGLESGTQERFEHADLVRLLGILWRGRWLIVAGLVLGTVATVLHAQRQPTYYRASTSLLVDPVGPEILGSRVEEAVKLGADSWAGRAEYYNSQIALLSSETLAEHAVGIARLDEKPRIAGTGSASERKRRAVLAVRRGQEIIPPREDRVIQIRYTHADAQVAAELANALASAYIDFNSQRYQSGNVGASQFLSGEIDETEQSLSSIEAEIDAFKRKHDLLAVPLEDARNLVSENIAHFSQQELTARAERLSLQNLRKRIATTLGDASGRLLVDTSLNAETIAQSPVFELLSSEGGSELRHKYVDERARLVSLQNSLGPKHPEYVAQARIVDELAAGMRDELRAVVGALEAKYQTAVANEESFKAELNAWKERAFALGPIEGEYRRLERKRESTMQRLGLVVDRYRANELAGRVKSSNVSVLRTASPNSAPIRPNLAYRGALGAIFGTALGIGAAFLLSFLDRRIRGPEDVHSADQTPLGVVPTVPANSGSEITVFLAPNSKIGEACRIARTNLIYSMPGAKLPSLLITSPETQEGKTSCALWIAAAYAETGRKVVLVDSDLRRPRVHHLIGATRTPGLSDVLADISTLESALRTTDIPTLKLLPAGREVPNPANVLGSTAFEHFLPRLEEAYDLVILDSPPVLPVADSSILAPMASAVLLVVRAERTRRDALKAARERLDLVGGHVIGQIFNDFDTRKRYYGYSYSYAGYGYAPTRSEDAIKG